MPGRVWAARLGLVALVLNSLVPIHLAFDLVEALHPTHHRTAHIHAEFDGVERHLLALLTGHREGGHHSHEHGQDHGTGCPVCSALGALTGFAVPMQVAVSAPALEGLPATVPLEEGQALGVFAAYRSRAPPIA